MKKLIIIISCIAVISCNEIRECDLNPETELVGLAFFQAPDSTERIPKTVTFDSVTNSSNIRFTRLDTALQFAPVLLDPTSNQISYYFETDSNTFELLLEYRVSKVALYSLDCGGGFSYDSLQASAILIDSIRFDSVAVSFNSVNKNIPVNVEVFF